MAKAARPADNGSGARGRATSPTGCVPGIFRFALQRGGCERVTHSAGQFDHRRLSEQDRPDVLEVLDDSSVVVKDLVGVRFRSPGRRNTLYGEKILGCVGNAVQRPAVVTATNLLFRKFGLFQSDGWSQPRVGIEARSEFLAALEVALGKFHGRELF